MADLVRFISLGMKENTWNSAVWIEGDDQTEACVTRFFESVQVADLAKDINSMSLTHHPCHFLRREAAFESGGDADFGLRRNIGIGELKVAQPTRKWSTQRIRQNFGCDPLAHLIGGGLSAVSNFEMNDDVVGAKCGPKFFASFDKT